MDLILNDCSIHGQFQSLATFRDAVGRVMNIREVARQFGSDLQCHRNVASSQVTPNLSMREAAPRALDKNEFRVLMRWIDRHGPFWDDLRQHSSEDLLESNGEIVTDTAVGEAAYCLIHGISRSLVSLDPSSWTLSPVHVRWHIGDQVRSVEVLNFIAAEDVRVAYESSPASLGSWKDLEAVARVRCSNLTFSVDSFDSLEGHPFGKGAADRLLLRLAVLNSMKDCFGEDGALTPAGHTLYSKHFTGEKAWFSDSSDAEKSRFESEFTFPHPTQRGRWLFCPWHGKVKTPQLRIHFSWPIQAYEPLYVVYVGPKIAKW